MLVELPYPPSLNHYYRSVKGRVLVSREGRAYRADVARCLIMRGVKPLKGRLKVEVEVYPPDNRRRDLDNTQKGLLDSLKHGGAYLDDSQIDELVIRRKQVVPGGMVEVLILEVV